MSYQARLLFERAPSEIFELITIYDVWLSNRNIYIVCFEYEWRQCFVCSSFLQTNDIWDLLSLQFSKYFSLVAYKSIEINIFSIIWFIREWELHSNVKLKENYCQFGETNKLIALLNEIINLWSVSKNAIKTVCNYLTNICWLKGPDGIELLFFLNFVFDKHSTCCHSFKML